MSNPNVTRYPDAELEEFKAVVEQKLTKTKGEIANLNDQIEDATENEHSADMMDESASNENISRLYSMLRRQKVYQQELESALEAFEETMWRVAFKAAANELNTEQA